MADEPFAAPEIRRLEELRLEAEELAIDADLALGRHQELAAEIDALVVAHPLRERLHGQRMLALYRCGRQAEALEAYREARRTLVDEIGVEPGPELRALHDAILRQDPALAAQPAPPELPRELASAASVPLAGRQEECATLRAQWYLARENDGAVVTIAGARGIGKTRLAAELARVAYGEGATVLYAAGTGAPEAALAVIARARAPRRRTLLIVDDVDQARPEVPAAIRHLAGEPTSRPALVIATSEQPGVLPELRPHAALALEPLDAGAVRQIAAAYAPDVDAADLPVEALRAAGGGVPRRVHEAARDWAQRAAAERVGAVASRAAAGRTSARALEAELAGSVVALQSAQQRADRLAAASGPAPVLCPFKGLASFGADDAEYFFGREQLVAELVARLVGAPLLAIVGPSGSGKSSLLRAGVLPALAAGVLPGSDGWACALVRPGEHPLRELRRVAPGLQAAGRAVLAVDQFEETFTACRDEREREAFADALVRAAEEPDGGTVVVLAVRADFYARCASYPQLARLVGANQVLVGPMSRDELRRVITSPAERVGLIVEPELEDALVADVEGRPGGLPLLSTTLLELWRQRRGRRLQLAAYSRTGGVHAAVARLAEDALGRLEPPEREAARKLLLRLAEEGDDGRIVRRRVPLAELEAAQGEPAARALDLLTDRRLLTVSEGTVEVAHEALLREWPRLRGWLEDDAEGRRLHRHLTLAASEWEQRGGDRTDLYRGARLASALEWSEGHAAELSAAERAFLDASRAASERARRRVHLALAGVIALLLVATTAAVLALDGRERAREQARAAEAQRLGAQALTEQTLDRSLLLARQGVALDDTPATRDSLLAAVRRTPAAIGVMRGDGDGLAAVALHPNGRTLAVGDYNGSVSFFDARSRRRIRPAHQSAPVGGVVALAFSPDGTRLAAAGWAAVDGGFVDLFDGRTGRHMSRLEVSPPLVAGVAAVSFSPDSQVLTARADTDYTRASRVLRWDARTGRRLDEAGAIRGAETVLVGSLDGALVTSSPRERATHIRDDVSLRIVRSFPVAAGVAAVSPAGVIAFGSGAGSVRLLDVRTGDMRTARGRHDGPVTAMQFSADGRRLVTAGRDERVIAWDTRGAKAVETVKAPGRVTDVAIARDGRTAFSAGHDGTVIAWDLAGERRLERAFAAAGRGLAPRSLTVAPDGSRFAVTDARGFIDLFDGRTLRLTGRVPVRAAPASPSRRSRRTTARSRPSPATGRSASGTSARWQPLQPLRPAHGERSRRDHLQPRRALAGHRRRRGRAAALGRAPPDDGRHHVARGARPQLQPGRPDARGDAARRELRRRPRDPLRPGPRARPHRAGADRVDGTVLARRALALVRRPSRTGMDVRHPRLDGHRPSAGDPRLPAGGRTQRRRAAPGHDVVRRDGATLGCRLAPPHRRAAARSRRRRRRRGLPRREHTSLPSRTSAAATPGTCARRRGSATPVRSPGAP